MSHFSTESETKILEVENFLAKNQYISGGDKPDANDGRILVSLNQNEPNNVLYPNLFAWYRLFKLNPKFLEQTYHTGFNSLGYNIQLINQLGHNIQKMIGGYLNYSSLHNLIICYKGAKSYPKYLQFLQNLQIEKNIRISALKKDIGFWFNASDQKSMELNKNQRVDKWHCQITKNFLSKFKKQSQYKQKGDMPQYTKFSNIPSVRFNFNESGEIYEPVIMKTIISINSWDAEKSNHQNEKAFFYIFGCNQDYLYPFHGQISADGRKMIAAQHATWRGNEGSGGGVNYQEADFKVDNHPYEIVNNSILPCEGMLHLNTLRLPNEGVRYQNTIGQEREYHEFRGHINQLIVYTKEKSLDELMIIEDIIKSESNFDIDQNTGYIQLFDVANKNQEYFYHKVIILMEKLKRVMVVCENHNQMNIAKLLANKLEDNGLINAISISKFNNKLECCEMIRSDNFFGLIKSIEIIRMPFE